MALLHALHQQVRNADRSQVKNVDVKQEDQRLRKLLVQNADANQEDQQQLLQQVLNVAQSQVPNVDVKQDDLQKPVNVEDLRVLLLKVFQKDAAQAGRVKMLPQVKALQQTLNTLLTSK